MVTSCAVQEAEYGEPIFEYFTYTGNDARYQQEYNPATHYLNPIISGTNPDPSICRQGNDFFMANSSFVYWPGIPVWHSNDLVDWDFCGYVLTRPTQGVFMEGLRITGGAYAPDIKYCEKNQTFYLIVTLVDGLGNVIFKTRDPYQGWSEPIPVPEVRGIDPSFLFDVDGKCYIVNNDEPKGPAQYDGHRAIWGRAYDLNTDKVCGPAVMLVDKGIHPEDKPIWIEGPHLYHFNNELEGRQYNQYYLMCAEGGTAEDHSEVVLTGKSPLGAFKPCQQNPILTQRTLAHNRQDAVSCTGHADLVQVGSSSLNNNARQGEWWSVFLGVTPYDGDQLYNTGRSTFLLPASWQRDAANGGIQPFILSPDSGVPTYCEKSEWQKNVYKAMSSDSSHSVGNKADKRNLLAGNGSYTDRFEGNELYPLWFTLRTPENMTPSAHFAPWYSITAKGVQIDRRSVTLNTLSQPSLLARWVKNSTYTVETSLLFTPKEADDLAGLTLFQTEDAYYIIGKRLTDKLDSEVVLIKTDKNKSNQVVATVALNSDQNVQALRLRAEVKKHEVRFAFSTDQGANWIPVGEAQDADILTTNYTGAFTGCVAGLYSYKN